MSESIGESSPFFYLHGVMGQSERFSAGESCGGAAVGPKGAGCDCVFCEGTAAVQHSVNFHVEMGAQCWPDLIF